MIKTRRTTNKSKADRIYLKSLDLNQVFDVQQQNPLLPKKPLYGKLGDEWADALEQLCQDEETE